MPIIYSFDDAYKTTLKASHRHVLLGNGFSIALRPQIFAYSSLYENADFSDIPRAKALFEHLGTKDFELIIRQLQDSANVLDVYGPQLTRTASSLRHDAELLKNTLVSTVAGNHPSLPSDVESKQYASCRAFLAHFDKKYTLNYDVLLYWTLMQDEVDDLNFQSDDGFRHPEEKMLPYVSWQEANSANVYYLHGALHLFDAANEIIKYTWSKTDTPIIEQIRHALDKNKYPLFVSEGTSESKQIKILHNAYLHKAFRSFSSMCDSATNALIIYGHSLAENDSHILNSIASGKLSQVLISIYGDINSDVNKIIVQKAESLIRSRATLRPKCPLLITYYDASSAKVWG